MTPISSRTMCRIIRARQIATAASAARNFSSNRKENSNLQLKVLYEDNHLLVISKPSNIACESGSLFKSKTKSPRACIQSLAEEYLQTKYNKLGKAYIGLVHRLDRWTTGVMVLAKTSKASQRLSQQFREKTIEKKYICVVSGHVQTAGECRHMLSNTREKNAITRGNINFSQAILDTRAHVHDYTTENITHNSIINPSNPSPNSQSEGYYEAHLTYRPLGSWTWPTGESIDEYKSHSENAIKSDKIQIMSLLEVTPSSGMK